MLQILNFRQIQEPKIQYFQAVTLGKPFNAIILNPKNLNP